MASHTASIWVRPSRTIPGPGVESPAALAEPPDFDRARAAARHHGPARVLVHALKFRDRLEVADVMAAAMVRAGHELLADCDVAVPVPLHSRRLFARRFNESALLVERVAAASGRPYAPFAIEGVKPTRHQVGLNARERRRNVSGAFRVASEAVATVAGRQVVVVDDC